MKLAISLSLLILSLVVSASQKSPAMKEEASFEEKLKMKLERDSNEKLEWHVQNLFIPPYIPKTANIERLHTSPPIGFVNFELSWADGSELKHAFGNAVIRAYAPVAVAKISIRHGETIGTENVSLERRELGQLGGTGYFRDLNQLKGYLAQGFLRPGSVINTTNSQAPYLVSRGQQVEVVYKRNSLTITARMNALESGRLQDWIRVENPMTKKVVQGKITGPSEILLR